MTHNKSGLAHINSIKRWSPVWIVPLVTLLTGAWILYYHFAHQGPVVTLITSDADGIIPGKTTIKSRSVNVGMVESAELSNDLHQVIIKARLRAGMEKMLHSDSVFWIVKPQIGREGVTGLNTLLSGSYIELQAGSHANEAESYKLLDSPPLAPPDAKGIRIILDSTRAGQLNAGDPVLFRGYRVGSVEASQFDSKMRRMNYQLFISAPYDGLVTSNVRFWKDSGIAFDMSAAGMRVELGSLATLLSGGVSFDVPSGGEAGTPAKNMDNFHLYDDQRSTQESLFTRHQDYLLYFNESIRGLQAGAPVEFRGIRLGTVAAAPFLKPGLVQALGTEYRVPVLIRIEPDRLISSLGKDFDFRKHLLEGVDDGLRASLKTANLITGALYVDLDFYDHAKRYTGPRTTLNHEVIPTLNGGLTQMQQKVMAILDKVEKLPLDPLIVQATSSLRQSQQTMLSLKTSLDQINQITASPAMKTLPAEMQKTIRELNSSIKGLQPGSPAYNRLIGDMQRLDQVLRELQPVLRTLNTKSNALVFAASTGKDPKPVRAKQ